MWRICGRGFDPRRLHQFKRARFFEPFFFFLLLKLLDMALSYATPNLHKDVTSAALAL